MACRSRTFTCHATDADSTHGNKLICPCAFNQGKANGAAKLLLMKCNNCGATVCRVCVAKLRKKSRAEVARLKHLKILEHPVLHWLLADRARAADLFLPSNGVTSLNAKGMLTFNKECIFCFNVQMPRRRPIIEMLLKSPSYPLFKPTFARREMHILQVATLCR